MGADASKTVRAGRRTYFFDVKETKEGKPYLVITESTFVGEHRNGGEDRRLRSRLMVFAESIEEFIQALNEVAQKIKPPADEKAST